MGFPESRNVAIEKYENEERSKEQETKKKKKRKVSRVVELQRRSTREGRGTGKDELKYRCAS